MRKLLVVVVIIIFLTTTGIACDGSSSITTYEVKYVVTGQGMAASIIYADEYGHAPRLTNVSLPWTYTFKACEGKLILLHAENGGSNSSITVTIYKNDKLFKTDTNIGAYKIAGVTGTL